MQEKLVGQLNSVTFVRLSLLPLQVYSLGKQIPSQLPLVGEHDLLSAVLQTASVTQLPCGSPRAVVLLQASPSPSLEEKSGRQVPVQEILLQLVLLVVSQYCPLGQPPLLDPPETTLHVLRQTPVQTPNEQLTKSHDKPLSQPEFGEVDTVVQACPSPIANVVGSKKENKVSSKREKKSNVQSVFFIIFSMT